MICHLCGQQAIGQCRSCLKFYCGKHGDGECGQCSQGLQPALSPARKELEPIGIEVPKDIDLRAYGATCAYCANGARGMCDLCGQFYCTAHRGRRFWQTGKYGCADCTLATRDTQPLVMVLVVAVFAIGVFAIVIMSLL